MACCTYTLNPRHTNALVSLCIPAFLPDFCIVCNFCEMLSYRWIEGSLYEDWFLLIVRYPIDYEVMQSATEAGYG